MEYQLLLSSKRLDKEDIQELTFHLAALVNSETNINANLPEAKSRAGDRGDPISIGMLALTFLTSGSAVALFQVMKSFFDRNKSLEICIRKEEGQEITFKSENMSNHQMEKSLTLLQTFWDGEK